jgi:periplasmic protein TonB
MATLAYPASKESCARTRGSKARWIKEHWISQRLADVRWSGGVGAMLTIGIHVAVIALLLAARTSVTSPPAPIRVSIIDAPQQAVPEMETVTKPRLDQPTLHVPQPEVATMDDTPSNTAPIAAIPSSTSSRSEALTPAVTQPVFDADYLNNPVPNYPPLAKRMREQGMVLVRVLVSSEGLPDQVELKRSSGSVRLDEAALNVVKKWRFVPARRGNEAVPAWVVVPVSFSLTA